MEIAQSMTKMRRACVDNYTTPSSTLTAILPSWGNISFGTQPPGGCFNIVSAARLEMGKIDQHSGGIYAIANRSR